ncbi:MAG: hypothetical protein Q7V00_03745 [Sulfurimicrobium sp.]|nr:hypothetical protein [Sulfurimicrobium sp.]MDP3687267.1 hypothetical protein [Sulfurimicrobium sp.]MDZ7656352.1 hypothetical protein [Sulfurimicrobium sp.]
MAAADKTGRATSIPLIQKPHPGGIMQAINPIVGATAIAFKHMALLAMPPYSWPHLASSFGNAP